VTFKTSLSGKWILAGEHSVLRGTPAVVFPLNSRKLDFYFTSDEKKPGTKDLTLELAGAHGGEVELLFWKVIDKACELKKIRRADLVGQIKIESTIPVGAGLGASAALCGAIARWFQNMNLIKESELLEFARNLENIFHGESSGVDVAVALSGKSLIYVRGGNVRIFAPTWQPKWYLYYSGKRAVTLECVDKVKAKIAKDVRAGSLVDSEMRVAVGMCEAALSIPEMVGFDKLVEAIEQAATCFEFWGLTEGVMAKEMAWLKSKGAAAVKPTGSGDGGYILTLWEDDPPPEVLSKLIPCF
jgi:mevalonate kinase